jgi:hypothetical protein
MEKKRALSKRNEFRPFPFSYHPIGNPKGQRLAVAFFRLLSLRPAKGRSKERGWPPGRTWQRSTNEEQAPQAIASP